MSEGYYSDRTLGPSPRDVEELTDAVWGGLVAIVDSGVNGNLFAQDFPERCPDTDKAAVIGCDRSAFYLALRGDLPTIELPMRPGDAPTVLDALDLVEFLHSHASEASERDRHGFYPHAHLKFNRPAGQARLRDQVNRLFLRNRLAYELSPDGRIQRLAPPILDDQLRHTLPPTQNTRLDDLLDRARRKFLDPDPSSRQEAIEHLWDAFERIKTVLDTDKKSGADKLLDAASGGDAAALDLLRTEMRALTLVGNNFRIRHHETTKTELGQGEVDYLFSRMYALLYRLHPSVR